MYFFWHCEACGDKRWASANEARMDPKTGQLQCFPCPCRSGWLKLKKSATMPDIPERRRDTKPPATHVDLVPTADEALVTAAVPKDAGKPRAAQDPLVVPDLEPATATAGTAPSANAGAAGTGVPATGSIADDVFGDDEPPPV